MAHIATWTLRCCAHFETGAVSEDAGQLAANPVRPFKRTATQVGAIEII